MRRRTSSSIVVLASVVAMATALAKAAGAAAPPGCDVAPSSFFDVFVHVERDWTPRTGKIEWTARTSTTLACPGMGIVPIDVWEHAVVAYVEDENGDGDLADRGEGRVTRGRCQIVIDFTGAGITIPLTGTVRGKIGGLGDDADIVYEVRAASRSGAQLELRHAGQLDLVNETFGMLDVSGGALAH